MATVGFAGIGATAASAAPRAASSVVATQLSTSHGVAAGPSTATALSVAPTTIPAGSTSVAPAEKVWGWVVKALVAAFKSIGGLWTKVVNAVKAGYAAFAKLWQSIPTWIKNITGGMWTVYEIWQALKDYIS